MTKRLIVLFVAILAFAISGTVFGQYQVSGQLDLVVRNNSAVDGSNKTFKGFSNFDFVRARVFFDAQPTEKVSVFTQVLIDNSEFQLYGAYVRLSKIANKSINVHAGIIPNPVGMWGPRTYSNKNPLVGVPLMYLYHTALAPGRYQTNNDQLLESRGNGFLKYGLPMMYDPCWNSGIEVFGTAGMIDWSIGALSGSISAPKIQREKDLPQMTAKVGVFFSPVFSLQFSGFAGPYLSDISDFETATEYYPKAAASYSAKGAEDYLNIGGGIGAHYDYGMLEIYGEAYIARWEHPIYDKLDAYSAYIDTRYKLAPQWYLAGRVETIRFSEYDFGGSVGKQDWDYPLNRFELGVGYHIDEAVTLKLITQIARSSDFASLDDEMVAFQLSTTIH